MYISSLIPKCCIMSHSNKFSLYSRLKSRPDSAENATRPPSRQEISEFLARMRQEDEVVFASVRGTRKDPSPEDQEYESSLVLAQKQIKMLEEALHNEKLVSEALRRKLAIYESNLPSVPPSLFSGKPEGAVGAVGAARPSASVSEWRIRLDEIQQSQLDRLTHTRR